MPGETTVRRYVCGVVGLLVTAGGFALLYPAVATAGHHFAFLTITALVGALVVVWLAVWTVVEVVWTRSFWRANGT